MIIPKDMPKLECPFVREGEHFLVVPKMNPGYEWVFLDTTVLATEKLDGTDVSIVVENGQVVSVWNRENRVPFFGKGARHLTEAVLNSFERGYCNLPDGQWFGEALGPKIQGNPYMLDEHLWIPFLTYARDKLAYKSWGKYPKTFEAIETWFKDGPMSLFMLSHGIKDGIAEGVVFHRPATGEMAKLRRDMFEFYRGPRHKETRP